jgi:hypothetical protein
MGALSNSLKQFSGSVQGLVTARGMAQLDALSQAEPMKVQGAMQRAGLSAGALLKTFLIASWKGGHSDVTGIRAALDKAVINAQPDKITVRLPEGCQFSNGKGNVYAAIGAYTFGGVRGKASQKTKKAIKDVLLKGGKTTSKAANRAISSGAKIIAPRPPLFKTSPQQDGQLNAEWVRKLRDELGALGIELEAV